MFSLPSYHTLSVGDLLLTFLFKIAIMIYILQNLDIISSFSPIFYRWDFLCSFILTYEVLYFLSKHKQLLKTYQLATEILRVYLDNQILFLSFLTLPNILYRKHRAKVIACILNTSKASFLLILSPPFSDSQKMIFILFPHTLLVFTYSFNY